MNEAGASETVTDGHIRGSDADDEIIGFSGENFVELGAGDDIFAALSNQGETGDNRWDFYDRVRYDHASENYTFGQTYLELVDGQFTRDQDGQIVEYLEAGDNRLLFTKVIDKRPDGDGVDYLYGVEEVQFQDRNIDFGIRSEVRSRDLQFNELRDYNG